ncbi:hypothetical protein RA19_00115 [Leisingera sp. ANG-M1]|uniref:hypothetical protein n=1 Tax=Leisingera sp. ANG-M1 TaxID=1577895 RepID=UPI00057DB8AC|nr:hypothetical protein [Leisingera sp. ANG-M1]KIC12851.1 hypothetical protein RA19_00115 [Leisingera sp. ANG-M1]
MLGVGLSVTGAAMRGRRRAFSPAALFAGGGMGSLLDLSTLAGLFRDIHGQQFVSGAGDPVALVLDGSQGIRVAEGVVPLSQRISGLEAEMVANGVFDTSASWTMNNGASISGGVLNLSAANDAGKQNLAGSQGKFCLVTFDTVKAGGANLRIYLGGAIVWEASSPTGFYELILQAGTVSDELQFRSNGFLGSVDNVSARVIPGHHALQPVDDDHRPLLAQEAGGAWYLVDDQVGGYLQVELPDLGSDATEWWADETGVTINSGQTINTGARLLPGSPKLYAYGVINRALTVAETSSLTAFLNT